MKIDHGIFTVSLDFELYWGILDVKSIQDYQENLKSVPKVIEIMLELFEEYEVHATWATVGFLFAQDVEELKQTIPTKIPNYNNPKFNPYLYITNNNTLESCYHFAPYLIDKIHNYKNQEIGTHTFSHYYCLEEGQSKEEFSSDIEAAIMMAKNNGEMVEYEHFRDRAYNVALGLSIEIKEYEAQWRRRRNDRISAGLPQPPVDDRYLSPTERNEKMNKFESSKERFKSHFIGMSEDAWNKKQKLTVEKIKKITKT